MKISVNDVELFSLTEEQKKVIQGEICCHDFESDMKRRLQWVLNHKYEQCFKRLKEEWEPKLKAAGVQSVPLDNDAFAKLVFDQPQYKDRYQRDLQAKAAEEL